MPFLGIFSGNKLCTILSGGLAGFGPILYKFDPDSVEMPSFMVWMMLLEMLILHPIWCCVVKRKLVATLVHHYFLSSFGNVFYIRGFVSFFLVTSFFVYFFLSIYPSFFLRQCLSFSLILLSDLLCFLFLYLYLFPFVVLPCLLLVLLCLFLFIFLSFVSCFSDIGHYFCRSLLMICCWSF